MPYSILEKFTAVCRQLRLMAEYNWNSISLNKLVW